MAQLSELERSYSHVLLYPPQPAAMVSLQDRQANFSSKMYGFYLQEMRELVRAGQPIRESFLAWHRCRKYGTTSHGVEIAMAFTTNTAHRLSL